MKAQHQFPVEIKKGNSTVKIYRSVNKGYDEFKVAHYDASGKRRLKTCATFQAARSAAASINNSVASGNIAALTLTNDDKVVYLRAVESLRKTGKPLDVAAMEYAECVTLLHGESLKHAVADYVKRQRHLVAKMIPEVVRDLIEQKERSGAKPASKKYLDDLRLRLGRFADCFHCPIAGVGPDEIRKFLDTLGCASGRTRFNYARLIRTLFQFAKARRYYPKDADPLEGIETAYASDGEIEIFTPAELSRILSTIRRELVPFIAIGAFAGLRHEEIKRLDWAQVNLVSGFIEVKAGNAKTKSRRLVPVADNLRQWLVPFHQGTGPVVPFANVANQLGILIKDSNASEKCRVQKTSPIEWKRNGLRHSFISYRVAQIQNVAQVSLEAGNSPQMIFSNYRELVTPSDATKWFGIMPDTAANVIALRATA